MNEFFNPGWSSLDVFQDAETLLNYRPRPVNDECGAPT
jgi:hypothetical protein